MGTSVHPGAPTSHIEQDIGVPCRALQGRHAFSPAGQYLTHFKDDRVRPWLLTALTSHRVRVRQRPRT